MYLFQTTLIFVVAMLLIRANALPRSTSPSLAQRDPTDLKNIKTLELDDILPGSKISPPTGKVTLTRGDERWNMDNREWLVYEVEGLIDKNGKPMTETVTATTSADGKPIALELINKDTLLGYAYNNREGLDPRWWILELKVPPDISLTKEVGISKLFFSYGRMPLPFHNGASFGAVRNSEDDNGTYLSFIIPNWPDGTEVRAFTEVNGARPDQETVRRLLSQSCENYIELLEGFEEMTEPYRRRWWLVYTCDQPEFE